MIIQTETIREEILISCIQKKSLMILKDIAVLLCSVVYLYLVYVILDIKEENRFYLPFPLLIPSIILFRDTYPDAYDNFIVTSKEIIFFSQTYIPKKILRIKIESLKKIETGQILSTQIFKFTDHNDVMFTIRNSKTFTAACLKTEKIISDLSRHDSSNEGLKS